MTCEAAMTDTPCVGAHDAVRVWGAGIPGAGPLLGCEYHAARLLTCESGAWVGSNPGHPGAAARVFREADDLAADLTA